MTTPRTGARVARAAGALHGTGMARDYSPAWCGFAGVHARRTA